MRWMQNFFNLKKKKKKKIYTAVSEISCMFSIDGMSQQYRENIIVARKDPSFP